MQIPSMRSLTVALAGVLTTMSWSSGFAQTPQTDRPVFRAAVDRVTVAVTVRDKRGRTVTSLKADDFNLTDSGRPQPNAGAINRPKCTPIVQKFRVDVADGEVVVAYLYS